MDKWCIYRITNTINHKTYIGQHKYYNSLLVEDNYMGSGIHLKRAQKKYGIENFTKEIITIAMSQLEANVLEKYYIEKERKSNIYGCYNIADGGLGGSYERSLETRRKLSLAQKGKHSMPRSEEQKRNISEAHKGIKYGPRSEEHRRKLSEAHKGKHFSEETRKKMSETRKGKPSGREGKHQSEEAKKKISEAAKARWAKKRGER